MHPSPPNGLIIFDGGCGVCTASVWRWRSSFARYGFAVTPLQEPGVAEQAGVDEATLLEAIHLLTPNGSLLRGVDACAAVIERVWWLWPFSQLLRVKPIKALANAVYRAIAKRRTTISQVCGLRSLTDHTSPGKSPGTER